MVTDNGGPPNTQGITTGFQIAPPGALTADAFQLMLHPAVPSQSENVPPKQRFADWLTDEGRALTANRVLAHPQGLADLNARPSRQRKQDSARPVRLLAIRNPRLQFKDFPLLRQSLAMEIFQTPSNSRIKLRE